MLKLFISYRRKDSRHVAGRLYDHLAIAFGDDNVFMDVQDIPAWVDFTEHIRTQIDQCDALLVIIGPQWSDMRNTQGIRCLESPEDFVRREIEMGISRDLLIAPVLVDDAIMPDADDLPPSIRAISRSNALALRADPYFRRDVQTLIEQLHRRVGAAQENGALAAPPPGAARFFNQGYSQIAQGAFHQAVESFGNAIRMGYAPLNLAYTNRGWAYYNLGQYDHALDDMTYALELDPAHPLTYLNRGLVYRERGQYEQAVEDFNQALKHGIDPPGWAYHNRGTAYRLMGQLQRALEDFTQALEVNPELENPHWGMGNVFNDWGDHATALYHYRRYLDVAGENANSSVIVLVRDLERQLEARQ